ncbi:cation:proton antiporter [Colwellia ponticola]|uniref:Sodium:proton antiporter n=1 Tax=Colwellia ponticola TaxID=2304625 RepID=A0A8H2JK94_9GAMM|nr:cation:proton antiporter [Colwellia ponticola]TMM43997.1 sodium:proton antiporter [Colwellia ponticola]
MEVGVLVVFLGVCGYAMLAKRLSSTFISAPMVFITLGFAVSYFNILQLNDSEEIIYLIAEVALIVLLFLDASQVNLKHLKQQNALPLRMLLLGLPLAVLLGTLAGMLFVSHWPITLIILTAAILAPTDAALSQAVICNKTVPEDVRQTLSVESGLNDGLGLPIILFCASFLAMHEADSSSYSQWLWFGGSQIFIGLFAGVIIGWSSARLFLYAESHKLTSSIYEGIAILALTGITYLSASLLGGNGFIAAFIGGLTFGNRVRGHCRFIYKFTESDAQMLVWAAFTMIGIGLLPQAIEQLTWPIAGYLLVSLFLVRPLAIYISLIGSNTKVITRLFMGWFGPRGLATALFALLVSHQILPEYSQSILVVAINAVWISTLLHGLSAAFLAKWYGRLMQSQTK